MGKGMSLLKPLQTERKSRLMNIKLTPSEFEALRVKAHRFTDGNVSAWIRYAAIELVPNPRDLVEPAEVVEPLEAKAR